MKPSDENVQAMEKRLREVIGKHHISLLSYSAKIATTRNVFYDQMFNRISEVNSRMDVDAIESPRAEKLIRLVSLDVPKSKVHEVLKDHASGMSAEFLNTIFDGHDKETILTKKGSYRGDEFYDNTHVTLAFRDESQSQTETKNKFDPVVGHEVDLLVTGLLWNDSHAAFAVQLEEKTIDDKPFPGSENSFAHITVWVAKDLQSSGSNDLPVLVKEGKAKRFDLETPVCIRGAVSYWYH